MGSGKTTVGKLLAEALNMSFLDLDDYIETRTKLKISDIFNVYGEIYFRRKEHEYLREVLENKNDLVLAAGGGTPCYSGNMQTILDSTENVFYIKLSVSNLVERLSKEKEERPLIRNIQDQDLFEFIGKHMFERSPFYTMARHTILCDNKQPDQIVSEIRSLLF